TGASLQYCGNVQAGTGKTTGLQLGGPLLSGSSNSRWRGNRCTSCRLGGARQALVRRDHQVGPDDVRRYPGRGRVPLVRLESRQHAVPASIRPPISILIEQRIALVVNDLVQQAVAAG